MSQKIQLYNTFSKTVEPFTSLHNGHVGIYSCGPTVYNYAHIGNLRAYVFADMLRRTLVHAGYTVTHVINITDVGHLTDDGDNGEDKLEKGAHRENKSVWDIARYYTDAFMSDIEALAIPQSAYLFPRATDTIEEQIDLIKTLEKKGYTYKINDGIYFDTSKYQDYGHLAKLDIAGLKSGARVEENKEKKNTTDFALWKLSPQLHEGQPKRKMEWDSPWGVGFPGWHIECSAMSKKILGNHFDIHTGGIDHIPVHHTNELAQSVCANGEPYVNYWMHVNFLNDTTGKMSKSNDDFLTLSTLREKGYDPMAYRYFLLMTHYKKEITFSYGALDAASVAYKKLFQFCEDSETKEGILSHSYLTSFVESLYDDINTPEAVATLWTMLKDTSLTQEDKYQTVLRMGAILGLSLEKAHKKNITIPTEIADLVAKRDLARKQKDFRTSDELRDALAELGYTVKDTKDGQEVEEL
ncbi:MAG: cysteinyl-tRNA synthetase [Candidatus Parcubacteria bacterium]|jgi:cysteinyl-tRNA synthetase